MRADYLSGAITAEEYARLRKEVTTGQSVEPAEAPTQTPFTSRPATRAGPIAPVVPATTLDPWRDPVTGLRLASWGRRAGALLLDAVLLIALYIPTVIWVLSTEDPATGEVDTLPATVFTLQLLFFPSLYTWLMLGLRGATMGKLTVGIVVLRAEDGARIGLGRALGRVASVFLLSLLTIPILLSYLWPLWDRRCQTLHDKMAGTIVVMEKG